MAARLRRGLEAAIEAGDLSDVTFTQPTQTNAVFAVLRDPLRTGCAQFPLRLERVHR
jgi:hypothetical protein